MESKTIFIACPIGGEGSEIRQHSDKVFEYLIEPVVKKELPDSATVKRADMIAKPGKITNQILQELARADVVIADLTNLNANVLYELGIRQGLRRPYILIAQKGTDLPFDLREYRTVFYELTLETIRPAKKELLKHLREALVGDRDSLDQYLLIDSVGAALSTGSEPKSNYREIVVNALSGIADDSKTIQSLIHELERKMLHSERAYLARVFQSGSYVFIEGERPSFAELIAATLRAKNHVRSTRFFPMPIANNQPDYAEAIRMRVKGTGGFQPLNHYSRIVSTNNLEKLADIEGYIQEFSGKSFTLYLTPYTSNFELVIIDNTEIFVHFPQSESVIGSTLHIFGQDITPKFISIFDKLHDPTEYPGIKKYDCKYILTTEQIEKTLTDIREVFQNSALIKQST